jgi:hypothetical protein
MMYSTIQTKFLADLCLMGKNGERDFVVIWEGRDKNHNLHDHVTTIIRCIPTAKRILLLKLICMFLKSKSCRSTEYPTRIPYDT